MQDDAQPDLVVQIARIIDPSSWAVMDSYLEQTKRKYRGQNVAWPEDQFQHKESMAKAREILDAIDAPPPAPAQPEPDVIEAMCDVFMGKIVVDGNGGLEFLEEAMSAALAAMPVGEPVSRVEELPMIAFSDRLPVRDEFKGEQTILTYSENVGVFSLEFFESGWDFPDRWLGASHWLDISEMWPGVTAQVTEYRADPPADADAGLVERIEALEAENGRLREALKRCATIVDRNLYRQHEKVEDVPKIARQALGEG